MVTTTTTTTISGGALAGILIGGLAVVGLLIWLTKLLTLYFYLALPEKQRAPYYANATENQCCDEACIACNMAVIGSCCPTLKTDKINLYNRQEMLLTNTNGGGNSML